MARLRSLDSESAQTCVTSPPYWGLRDYGTAIWQGGDPECDHVSRPQASAKASRNRGALRDNPYKGECGKCGALRVDDQLGLERTPEEYVARLVEIFREVKRVLRNDGTLWLNLGDSYFGDSPARKTSSEAFSKQWNPSDSAGNGGGRRSAARVGTLKPKDLCMIPARVALALQADGWYLRSDIIWAKPNPMPESVRDRPTKAHEYIFLLSKSAKYYYDADAIKEPWSGTAPWGKTEPDGGRKQRQLGQQQAGCLGVPARDGRNRRSVWTVATKGYPEAHFATFPTELIKPCILAGAPEAGVVIDLFCGSGTTGAVAVKYGRKFIGIELNPAYVEMAQRRIADAEPKQTPLSFVKTVESDHLQASYQKNETIGLYKNEAVAC